MGDDGWGPVERGGGDTEGPPATPPEPAADTEGQPAAPAQPAADTGGFGPVQRGRARPTRNAARQVGGERPPPTPADRGTSPAAAPHRARRLTPRRSARVLLLAVAVLGLAVAGTGAVLAVYTSTQINRVQVDGLGSADGRMNVLVVGNDSRQGLTDEELLELGTEAVDGDRTDTIFLLSISGGRAAMLSLPRDLYVTRCDGTQGRINAAYALGGPTCMAQTVTQMSGIPVTHYAEVNFLGFIKIVDAVGGVTLFFEEAFVDRPAGIDVPAGCQRLDGSQSIGFVRARTVDGDLGRIARQQRFIAELADEVTQPSTLLNPVRLFVTGGSAGRALTASENLGLVDLLRLARAGRGFAGDGLATYTVPAGNARIGGAAVLVPDEGAADALFAQFRDGSILDPAPAPEDAAPEAPAPEAPGPAPDDAAGAAPVPADC
ncbi:MAG: LCP family protein [Egibacteraceae bacterium]